MEDICVVNGGDKFNNECEGKSVEIKNLYLYPAENNDFQDGIYLYNSNLHSTYSDSINGDLAMQDGNYIIIYAKENLNLFNSIKNKIAALKNPTPVNIKGKIKSSSICTQAPSGCKYSFVFILESISYN